VPGSATEPPCSSPPARPSPEASAPARPVPPPPEAAPSTPFPPRGSLIAFPNAVQEDKYRLTACESGLVARIAGSETQLSWDRIERLSLEQVEVAGHSIGYVRITGRDGGEVAWSDQLLLAAVGVGLSRESLARLVWSGTNYISLFQVKHGLLLAAIVIDRACLVEREDGVFLRSDAVETPDAAPVPVAHRSPEEALRQAGSASRRVKQVLLLVGGVAAASWLWGADFAVALLVYLLIHEYGHVAAMKWCGVRVVGIFVLPFMGAAAVSEDEPPTHWQGFLIAYMGPVFGAVITLGAAIAMFVSRGQVPFLREIAVSWAAISLFNLLPLGVLDGGRIVASIAYSTHRIVGVVASVATALLCVLAAVFLRGWLLGVVALMAFAELAGAGARRRLARDLSNLGCDPARIRAAMLACWEKLGPLDPESSGRAAKKASAAKREMTFLRPFLSGQLETLRMTFPRILAAIGLYLGLLLFFVVVLALAASVGTGAGAEAHLDRGNAHLGRGEHDAAIAAYESAIRLKPDYAEAHYNLGFSYGQMGRYDEEVAEYTKAIELKPDCQVAYRARGVAYDNQGDYDRAMADLTKAIQLDSNDALAYGNRGIVYSDMRQLDKAIADYTEAIRLEPGMAAAYALRARGYCAKGDLDNAIADGTRAVELQPDNAEAYNDRGFAYYRKGEHDQAIADYTKAIELDHDFGPAYRNRGNAFGDKQLYDQAIADLGEVIRCNPSDAWAYYCRGNAYTTTGRHDAAIKDYTEAIRLDPQYGWAWCNRGSAYLAKGDYDEALADYNEALRLDPQDDIALANRFVAATSARLKKQGGLPDIPRTETDPVQPGPKVPGTDRKEDDEQPPSPPSARRVAARAIVLAAIVYRSRLERYASNPDAEPFRRRVLGWLDAVGLSSELEQGEREYLETPVGQAAPQTQINGCWRGEGLAVLAWALKRYELPPYDQNVDLLTAADGVGFLDANSANPLLRSAVLRPSSDIDGCARHATIVHWRLRQFSLSPGPMDFLGYLKKHPGYREVWLDGLRFVEGDLAIGEMGVAKVAGERFETCRSAAMERQIAAYWLQGDHKVYSEVDSSTILMGL